MDQTGGIWEGVVRQAREARHRPRQRCAPGSVACRYRGWKRSSHCNSNCFLLLPDTMDLQAGCAEVSKEAEERDATVQIENKTCIRGGPVESQKEGVSFGVEWRSGVAAQASTIRELGRTGK
jgi:hypothetical protein